MRLLVDGDSSGHRDLILEAGKEFAVEVHWANNLSQRPPVEEEGLKLFVYVCDHQQEAADIKLMNLAGPGDLVVTGDIGLAMVVISKGAAALSPKGFWYHEEKMAVRLEFRHLHKEVKRGGRKHKMPKHRPHLKEDDQRFEDELRHALGGA